MAVFMFDIDGTITPPRQRMTEEFLEFFLPFCIENKVYLCTGSDWPKVVEQVPTEILEIVEGVFTCSGNALWRDMHEQENWRNDWQVPAEVLTELIKFSSSTKSPHVTGRHLETRVGMVNFSTIGRNCTQEQREEYEEWDNEVGERRHIVDVLSAKFPDLDFNIGGQISIDIHPKGNDKSRAVLLATAWEQDEILFFGDRLMPGGNDWAVTKVLKEQNCVKVDSWQDTLSFLSRI